MPLLLTISASKPDWPMMSGDVHAAFLKGDPYETRLLCMDQLIRKRGPSLPPGIQIKVRKGVFGLADAPRAWYGEAAENATLQRLDPVELGRQMKSGETPAGRHADALGRHPRDRERGGHQELRRDWRTRRPSRASARLEKSWVSGPSRRASSPFAGRTSRSTLTGRSL